MWAGIGCLCVGNLTIPSNIKFVCDVYTVEEGGGEVLSLRKKYVNER